MIKLLRRKYLLTIEIDGHEWKDVIRELQEQVDHIEAHGENCSAVGGGGSTGHIVSIDIDPTKTPEQFERECLAYFESLHKPPQGDGKGEA